jgi:hypothetical protein
MPKADRHDGPFGDIISVVRGCEYCAGEDIERDVDGIWCCSDCGMTTLRPPRGGGR